MTETHTPALLTLHSDRLDRLPPRKLMSDGEPTAGTGLFQDAIKHEVITWDRAVWGDLLLTMEPHVSPGNAHPHTIRISYLISDRRPWLVGEVEPEREPVGDDQATISMTTKRCCPTPRTSPPSTCG